MTAEEAASLIQNGQTIGLSGFTPAGAPKCTPAEIAKRAEAEHAAGRPFKISVFTGASTGQSCDGMLSNAHALDFRAPYTTNPDFRKNVNRNELNYSDLNLSNMATQIRQGYLGQVHWAIIEACAIEKVGSKAHIYLTAAGGISPTVCRLATEGIIIELNAFHSPKSKGIHDVYEIEDHPHRTPIMITKASDRIGKPYVEVDADRIVGVIECDIPDEARGFKDPDPITSQIGQNVADFLLSMYEAEDERISSLQTRMRLAFSNKIYAAESALNMLQARVKGGFSMKIANMEAALRVLETRIMAADPRRILERGYALAVDENGVVVKGVAGKEKGDRISMMFPDGTLDCTVDAVRN